MHMDALNNLFPETSVKKIHQFQAYFVHRNTSEIPFFNAQLKNKNSYTFQFIYCSIIFQHSKFALIDKD